MYLVEYLGDGSDIAPQDEEIDKIEILYARRSYKKIAS